MCWRVDKGLVESMLRKLTHTGRFSVPSVLVVVVQCVISNGSQLKQILSMFMITVSVNQILKTKQNLKYIIIIFFFFPKIAIKVGNL